MAHSPMQPDTELTYEEAAQFFQCSPRHVRNILKAHAALCPPRRYGHRTVRFPWSGLQRIAAQLRRAAVKGGRK